MLGRALGPFVQAQTYRNLLYLFLRFPLGVAYFAAFLTMLTVGVVLTPFVVGIPILALTLAAVGYVGAFEARLAGALLDVEIAYEPLDPETIPMKSYLKRAVTEPHNYVLLIAAFAAFPIGMATFLLLTFAGTFTVAFVLAPVLYQLPGVTYGVSLEAFGGGTVFAVDSLPEALGLSLVGLLVLVVSVHVLDLAARLLGRLLVALLDGRGPGQTEGETDQT